MAGARRCAPKRWNGSGRALTTCNNVEPASFANSSMAIRLTSPAGPWRSRRRSPNSSAATAKMCWDRSPPSLLLRQRPRKTLLRSCPKGCRIRPDGAALCAMSAPARTIGGLIARRGYFIAILLGALFFVPAGCAQHPKSSIVSIAPPAPGTIGFQPGTVDGAPGVVVELPHYRICSTMADRTILTQIGQVMEGALGAYQSLSPNVPLRGGPMECYIFQSRSEWAAFTKAHTGEDATVYLRVNRGGYTVGDWFVAYWIGTPAT